MCNNLTMGYFECDGSKNPLWECCQQFGLCQPHGRGIGAPPSPLRCRKAALLHYPFSQSLNTNFQVLEPSQKLANGATSARLLGGLKLRPITHTHSRAHIQIDTHTHGVPTSGKTNCALVDSSTLPPSPPRLTLPPCGVEGTKQRKEKSIFYFDYFPASGQVSIALRYVAGRGVGEGEIKCSSTDFLSAFSLFFWRQSICAAARHKNKPTEMSRVMGKIIEFVNDGRRP